MRGFCDAAAELGPKLGALLFQLPPNFKKDLAVFDDFLGHLPPRLCAAFEFRNESWLDEEVYARLRARNLALCVADSEKRSTPVMTTADYAYLRLRDEGYQQEDIDRWTDTARDLATRVQGCLRLLQARRRGERRRVRAADDGAAVQVARRQGRGMPRPYMWRFTNSTIVRSAQ